MLHATFWGCASAAALPLGAAVATSRLMPAGVAGRVLIFAAGALISAFAFTLDEKAYELGGGVSATVGVVGGAFLAHLYTRRAPVPGPGRELFATAILGAGVVAITVVEDGDVGGAVLLVVFLWNAALALSLSLDLRRSVAAVVAAGIAAAFTYAVLDPASDTVVAVAHAAVMGALLVIVADRLLRVPLDVAGPARALLLVLGFAVGFALSIV